MKLACSLTNLYRFIQFVMGEGNDQGGEVDDI